MKRDDDSARIVEHVVAAIEGAAAPSDPFPHLQLANVFPEDVYREMLERLPSGGQYRAMSGRSKEARDAAGTPTRTKLDLLPEFIRHLGRDDAAVWGAVGRALCSAPVRDAFVRRLAPQLRARFGDEFDKVGFYPIPILTRDVAGYRIGIHPDTRRKGITVQLYLPRDDSIRHVGTAFHRKTAPKTYEKVTQMPFAPNVGYAFAVADDTYHSVETVGPEVRTRDSILLTYFVDNTLPQRIQNRGKRFGNFVLNEVRSLGQSA
jgi:hypothetical protein